MTARVHAGYTICKKKLTLPFYKEVQSQRKDTLDEGQGSRRRLACGRRLWAGERGGEPGRGGRGRG